MSALTAPALAAETAVAPEKNPPGDIPDTQVFITYHAPQGFSLKVPEGWARTDLKNGAKFVDKLDGVVVTASAEKTAPTVASVKQSVVPKMKAEGHAVKVSKVAGRAAAGRQGDPDRLFVELAAEFRHGQEGAARGQPLHLLARREGRHARPLCALRRGQCRPVAADVAVVPLEMR